MCGPFIMQKITEGGIPIAGRKPKPEKGMPVCPEWLLPEAKAEWKCLSEKLNQMGVLTEVDMEAFAAYCQSYARWEEAQEHIDSGGSTFETEKGYQQQTPWVGIANTNQKLMLQTAAEVYGAAADRQQPLFPLHPPATLPLHNLMWNDNLRGWQIRIFRMINNLYGSLDTELYRVNINRGQRR